MLTSVSSAPSHVLIIQMYVHTVFSPQRLNVFGWHNASRERVLSKKPPFQFAKGHYEKYAWKWRLWNHAFAATFRRDPFRWKLDSKVSFRLESGTFRVTLGRDTFVLNESGTFTATLQRALSTWKGTFAGEGHFREREHCGTGPWPRCCMKNRWIPSSFIWKTFTLRVF